MLSSKQRQGGRLNDAGDAYQCGQESLQGVIMHFSLHDVRLADALCCGVLCCVVLFCAGPDIV